MPKTTLSFGDSRRYVTAEWQRPPLSTSRTALQPSAAWWPVVARHSPWRAGFAEGPRTRTTQEYTPASGNALRARSEAARSDRPRTPCRQSRRDWSDSTPHAQASPSAAGQSPICLLPSSPRRRAPIRRASRHLEPVV